MSSQGKNLSSAALGRLWRRMGLFGATLVAAAAFVTADANRPAMAGSCTSGASAGVDWSDCRKRNLILDGTDLSGANLRDTDFTSTDLRRSKLEAANLSKSALIRAMFDSSTAPGANFEKALGYRTSFVGTDLSNAIFVKSEMQRANFTDANLHGANFSKSELGRADFSGADINNTVFSFSNLARADFSGAVFDTPIDFADAYLYETNLQGVDLSQATGLKQWQIDLACGDDGTVLPEGLQKPLDWDCEVD